MPIVDFGQVKERKDFEPLPAGKYKCLLEVDNIDRDSSGEVMKDTDGNPAIRHVKDGSESWEIKAIIIDGKYTGRWIYDYLSFGKAVGRVKTILKRAGIIEGVEDGHEKYNAQPEELDGTCWYVEYGVKPPGKGKEQELDKYGRPRMAITWAGYEPIDPKTAKHLRESYTAWLAKKNGAADKDEAEGENDDDRPPF